MAICSFDHASLSEDRFIKETLKSIQNIWAIKCDYGDTPAREKERKRINLKAEFILKFQRKIKSAQYIRAFILIKHEMFLVHTAYVYNIVYI